MIDAGAPGARWFGSSSEFAYEGLPDIPEGMTVNEWRKAGRPSELPREPSVGVER